MELQALPVTGYRVFVRDDSEGGIRRMRMDILVLAC